MVIPWDGYSLSEFINFCEPLPSAKFVQFISLYDKKQMPDAPTATTGLTAKGSAWTKP